MSEIVITSITVNVCSLENCTLVAVSWFVLRTSRERAPCNSESSQPVKVYSPLIKSTFWNMGYYDQPHWNTSDSIFIRSRSRSVNSDRSYPVEICNVNLRIHIWINAAQLYKSTALYILHSRLTLSTFTILSIESALNNFTVLDSCNLECNCRNASRFSPVCGKDLITYYSPCHAGCAGFDSVSNTYSDCACMTPGKWGV